MFLCVHIIIIVSTTVYESGFILSVCLILLSLLAAHYISIHVLDNSNGKYLLSCAGRYSAHVSIRD